MKKVLITGITGQDGAYLSKLLLEKGYEVYGAYRRTSELNTSRLKFLGVEEEIKYIPLELAEFTNIFRAIEKIQPDEIYNLAAQSFVAMSFEQPLFTTEITAIGPLRILEAIRTFKSDTKFYQASSSEMFGKVQKIPQNERTMFYPRSPYAASKLFAHWVTVNYRESYNLFASSGILFNHESPLRGHEFVTRKVTNSVAKIKYGLQEKIIVGNLEAKRDWGFAPEYVEAMWCMLQQDEPDDYVIATGECHSVRELIELAFYYAGFDIIWEQCGNIEKGIERKKGNVLVEASPELYRPTEVNILVGDYEKAKEKLGWQPKTTFNDLIGLMVEADIKNLELGRTFERMY